MGDHRASIKIEFSLPDKTYTQEWWINYWPDETAGVDHRISNWFSNCWEEYLLRYKMREQERYEREHQAEIEVSEREELARLKTKYLE